MAAGKQDPAPDLWDPLVRVSHWVLAATVILNALVTRGGGAWHVTLGWLAVAVLLLRLAWGLVGPAEARFAAFPPQPLAALRHLRALVMGRPGLYPSHNPAGAIMVYALWACLAAVIGTGLAMTPASPVTLFEQEAAVASGDWSKLAVGDEPGDEEDKWRGPLRRVHTWGADLMLVLAVLHVAGVAAESRALRRNLVAPMLFGRRPRG